MMTSFLGDGDRRSSSLLGTTALALLVFGVVACQTESEADGESGGGVVPPVVEIKATDYAFAMPDSIRSGWSTLRMANEGEEHHLFALLELPDGVSYADFQREVVASYDSIWTQVVQGKIEEAEAQEKLGPLLPEWYPSEVVQPGGVSLTAPGRTAQTTFHLDPGTYVLECYAKTPGRQYHALLGMVRPLTVIRDSSGASAPEADHELTVSDLELEGAGPVSPGEHTYAVHFEKDPEALRYQHVNLARLGKGTTEEDLAQWMEWDPVMPAPATFLGGAQHMPAGNTAYVTAKLEAGRYAWLVGVPPEEGEIEPFTVE